MSWLMKGGEISKEVCTMARGFGSDVDKNAVQQESGLIGSRLSFDSLPPPTLSPFILPLPSATP